MLRLLLTGLVLVLAACQAGTSSAPAPKGKRVTPKAASPRVVPATTPTASITSASSPAAPLAIDLLTAPEGATERLTGTLRVDAAYLVAAGGGNVLSHGGAQIVAAGGGNLVAAGAGNLVAAGGGNIVAAGAGNVVAAGAGNLVAAGAGNIVAAGGGNIVAAGGLNLMAGGGSLVAAGAGNYTTAAAALPAPRFAVFQAPGAPLAAGTYKAGDQLPAVGMLVSIVSLTSRRYLPMGVNAKGEPIFSIYTNQAGGYEAFVPAGEERNLLVVANVPGQGDGRLIYNTFSARAGEALQDVDEDTAVGARYLRRCFVGRLTEILLAERVEDTLAMATGDPNLSDAVKPLIGPMIERLRALAGAKGVVPGSDVRIARAFSQAVVDATLSGMDLDGIEISPLTAKQWAGPPNTRAMPIFGAVMKLLRERAEAYMRDPADPARYTARVTPAFLAAINESDLGGPPPPLREPARRIVKPTDLNDFVIEEFLAINRKQIYRPIFTLLTRLESEDPLEQARLMPANRERVNELESASSSVVTAVVFALAEDPTSMAPSAAAARAADQAARAFDQGLAAAEDQAGDAL